MATIQTGQQMAEFNYRITDFEILACVVSDPIPPLLPYYITAFSTVSMNKSFKKAQRKECSI